jgi:hypothetical protein
LARRTQVVPALRRQVDAQAEDLGQLVVVSGARDDAGIAGLREPGAGIVGEPPDHPHFAAVDDHVGDLLGQMGAAGNGEQVILSLGAGDLEQGVGGDAARMGEHLAGDRDLVVLGQVLDHFERRVIERCEPLAELGLGAGLDARNQQAKHVVEYLDLLVVQALAVVEKKISDPPQGIDALRRSAVSHGIFEFGDDRMGRLLHHYGQPVVRCRNSRKIAICRLTSRLSGNQ